MSESDAEQAINVDTPADKKMRWELRKLKLDVALASLGIAFVATFSIGALLLYCYFLRHGFNAGGISASDTVSFSLLLFGFVVTTFIGLVFVTLAAFPVSRAGHWLLVCLQEKRNAWRLWRRGATPAGEVRLLIGSPMRQVWRDGMAIYWWSGGLLFCVYLLGFIRAGSAARFFMGSMLLVGLWLAIFAFGTQIPAYSAWPKVPRALSPFDAWLQRQPFSIRQAVIASIVTIGMLVFNMGWIQDASMLAIGYRKHDVSVRLSKEDFDAVFERATRAGFVVNACQSVDPAMPVIDHMDVLWHALGTTALIRYPALPLGAPEAAERAAVQFEPLNASLTVISSVAARETCREFLIDTIFQPGQAVLARGAEHLLDEQLDWLGPDRARWTVHIAVLDPAGPGQTVAQAQALKAQLIRRYRLATSAIVIGAGRADRKRVCSGTGNPGLCEKANRRIEIRVDAAQ
jgi:hypothetical protein